MPPRIPARVSWRLTEEQELKTLLRVTAAVARARSVSRSATHITALVGKVTRAHVVTLEHFDREKGTAELLASYGIPRRGRASVSRYPLSNTLAAGVLRTGRPVVAPDATRRTGYRHSLQQSLRLATVIALPLRVDGKTVGALTLGTHDVRTVPGGFLAFLSALATEIGWMIGRARADRELRESADRYRHLFRNALDAILILDPVTGTILDSNLRMQVLAGRRRGGLIGASFLDLAPTGEVDQFRMVYATILRDREVRNVRHLHLRHRTRKPIPVEFNARLVDVGEQTLVIGILRDITEQQKAEVQLTASEELLRIIVEGTLDMFFYVHDTAGMFTYVSPSVAKITGHTPAQWKGHYSQFVTDNPLNIRVAEFTERALKGGAQAPPYQCEIYHADGRRILLEINEKPILREGKVIGIQGVARDITARKRLEEQLFQSQKMESIGLLAGGIAHDFNNILGGILGYSSYLKSTVPAGDAIHQHLETIERSALRAADLTAKLLAFARGGKYVVKPISMNAVVQETLRLLRGSIDKTITIEETLEPGLPAIEADMGQMQQVIMNLCVNARDAMQGGGRLAVRTGTVTWQTPFLISQPDLRHERYVRITVSDTGIGIEKSALGKIFDPFFTTKEKGKGTGLGLATVYGIVKNHNGYIEVQSEPGTGTSFMVYFPAVSGEAVTQEPEEREVSGGSETVLVVDDEETIRHLVRDLLASKGYRVLEAADGREALVVFQREAGRIDLVILDMVMPDMGGRETFIHLKELDRDVRTVLSTGYAEDERARELLAMGVMAFVQKPYRAEELAGVVRSVLDSRNQAE